MLGITDDWPSLGRIDRMLNGQEKTASAVFCCLRKLRHVAIPNTPKELAVPAIREFINKNVNKFPSRGVRIVRTLCSSALS